MMVDPLEIPADLRVASSAKILPIKYTKIILIIPIFHEIKNINCRNGPLQMNFWPRGRTSVRSWRISLRSLIVESMEISTGIFRPLNFTFNFNVEFPLSVELPFSIFHLFTVSFLWFLVVSSFFAPVFLLFSSRPTNSAYKKKITYFILVIFL